MERYDWGRARRGYWAGKLRIGEPEQRRILDADLVEAFPDSKSVNDALRRVVKAVKAVKVGSARRRRTAA
jgi:hypothetical protein